MPLTDEEKAAIAAQAIAAAEAAQEPEPTVSEQAAEIVDTAKDLAETMVQSQEEKQAVIWTLDMLAMRMSELEAAHAERHAGLVSMLETQSVVIAQLGAILAEEMDEDDDEPVAIVPPAEPVIEAPPTTVEGAPEAVETAPVSRKAARKSGWI